MSKPSLWAMDLKHGDQFFAGPAGQVSLVCEVVGFDGDTLIARVENGAWDGTFSRSTGSAVAHRKCDIGEDHWVGGALIHATDQAFVRKCRHHSWARGFDGYGLEEASIALGFKEGDFDIATAPEPPPLPDPAESERDEIPF